MTLVRVVLEKCLCVEKQETETLDVPKVWAFCEKMVIGKNMGVKNEPSRS